VNSIFSGVAIYWNSVTPLFTLGEFRRVTKPDGSVYVDPPRTGHFRLPREQSKPLQRLPAQSWFPLLSRVGFALECDITINFTMTYGPDTYRSYIVRRRG